MEFWRDLKPIEKVFQADTLPEVFNAHAATDDERYYVPFTETVSSRPLWISPSQNKWCDILMAKAAGLVNRHYHPHEVFAYTISGKWGYLEHDWIAQEGGFVYEPPGEVHTLVVDNDVEEMITMFNVNGAMIYVDENGDSVGYEDVFTKLEMCRKYYREVGLGADFVDQFVR